METILLPKLKVNQASTDQSQRLHGIDALRAIAMILGMLLHATIAYKSNALPNWPHDKDFNHWGFDFLYHFVHSFRMPLFFLIAGYFSRLLFNRLGEHAFIKHRLKRILVPFIFSLIFILPFTILPFSIYRYSLVYPGQWDVIFQQSFKQIFHWNGMAHLWFLYYLLIYYVLAITWFRVKKIIPGEKLSAGVTYFTQLFQPGTYRGMAIFILVIWSVLSLSPELYLHVDTGIIPGTAYLLFFMIFFLAGWLINKKPISFTWISNHFWLFISLGAGLCIALFLADLSSATGKGWQLASIKLFVAAQILLLVYGVIGFFLRYCQVENRFWRYISDASYWMYLIHLGIIAGLQIFLMNTPIPGMIRFLIVLIVPLAITLVTYHYLVRFTILGYYLHGKRKKIE